MPYFTRCPPFGCNSGHDQSMDLGWPELSTCPEFTISENTHIKQKAKSNLAKAASNTLHILMDVATGHPARSRGTAQVVVFL